MRLEVIAFYMEKGDFLNYSEHLTPINLVCGVPAMKTLTISMLVSIFLILAAPSYADSGMKAIQIFVCEFEEDATEDQLVEITAAWRQAAMKATGGKNIDVAIRFPIAEGASDDGDFRFVIIFPSFAEWGAFTDAYEGSEVAKIDQRLYDIADCGHSTMWEGIAFD